MKKLSNFFEIEQRNSTVKTEILAGFTTFFAMCYILAVNPSSICPSEVTTNGVKFFVNGATAIQGSVFIATAIGAFIGTLLMALYAKMPYAQAPGMGLNSFFYVAFMMVFALSNASASQMEKSYKAGLAVILVSGAVFLILSLTGARKAITHALPDCLKKSIPAGIGLFIAFIGFKNAGIIQANPYTFVQIANLAIFDKSQSLTWAANIAPVLVAFVGFILIAILSHKNVKGSIIIGILVSSVLYYIATWQLPAWDNGFFGSIGDSFKNFGTIGLFGAFKGFGDLADMFPGFAGFMNVLMLVITFTLVDMFDTMGTLQGTAAQADMLDENGNPQNLDQCLMCDSIATVVGAVCGTSTVTTYVESASGVAQGGRTGLTSLVVAGLFFLSMFLFPIFAIIPSAATAPALIYVGVLMLKNFKAVDMDDLTSAVPAFLTLIIMPLSYSISNGIAVGMISYTLMRVFTGKFEKKDIIVAILGLLFAIRFFTIYM